MISPLQRRILKNVCQVKEWCNCTCLYIYDWRLIQPMINLGLIVVKDWRTYREFKVSSRGRLVSAGGSVAHEAIFDINAVLSEAERRFYYQVCLTAELMVEYGEPVEFAAQAGNSLCRGDEILELKSYVLGTPGTPRRVQESVFRSTQEAIRYRLEAWGFNRTPDLPKPTVTKRPLETILALLDRMLPLCKPAMLN